MSIMHFLFTKTPLLFFVQDLWRDEAFSVIMARQHIGQILQASAADFSPPLYYLVLHFWMQIGGTSEIAIRTLSFLFYTLTLYIVFEIMVLVMQITLRRALLYSILIITNPFLLYYAFEARMYMMVTFFIVLSYFALWSKKKRLYILAITAALYTHYFAVLILITQMTPQLFVFLRKHPSPWRGLPSRGELLKKFIPHSSFLIPFMLFLPWLLFMLTQHNFSDRSFWVIPPLFADLWYLPFVLYTGYERVFGEYYHDEAGYTEFHGYINLFLIGILIVPILLKRGNFEMKKLRHILTSAHFSDIFLWTFFPPLFLFIISRLGTPVYHPRYFIFSSVGFLLLLILSIQQIASCFHDFIAQNKHLSKSLKQWSNKAMFIFIILYLLSLTSTYNTWSRTYHAKRTVSRIYGEIAAVKKADDVIYVTDELDYHLAQYYAKSDEVYIFNKTYEELPAYVGKVLIPASHIRSQFPVFPARAFVVYYNRYEVVAQE